VTVPNFTADYYPFGLRYLQYERPGSPTNHYLYNSNEWQAAIKQYDFNARFYDPVIARFAQVDPLADMFGQQTESSYAAFWNSPVTFQDKWGLFGNDDEPKKQGLFGTIGSWFSNLFGGKNKEWVPYQPSLLPEVDVWKDYDDISPSLLYLQFTLDFIGSTEVPIASQFADAWSAKISVDHGDYVGATLSAGGAIVPGASQAKLVRTLGKIIQKSAAKGGTKLLNQFNSAESLIQGAGKLSRVKGAQQGFVKGNVDDLFKSITQGGKQLAPNRVQLPNGTIITKYSSSTTGVPTLQINKGNQIFKIRIE
jgi:RHS repeat-associated protein